MELAKQVLVKSKNRMCKGLKGLGSAQKVTSYKPENDLQNTNEPSSDKK